MIEVLSFLFNGESFSFVRSLWLLDLNNRKTFLWKFSGSALHLMFSNGDWKIFSFLALWKFLWDLYFLLSLFCLQGGILARAFLQGGLNSLGLGSSCIREFSLVPLWSMITSCYFSVDLAFLSWYSKSNIVDVCSAGERVHWSLGAKLLA